MSMRVGKNHMESTWRDAAECVGSGVPYASLRPAASNAGAAPLVPCPCFIAFNLFDALRIFMIVLFDTSNYGNIFVSVYGFIYRFYLSMYIVFVISSFSKVKENLCFILGFILN